MVLYFIDNKDKGTLTGFLMMQLILILHIYDIYSKGEGVGRYGGYRRTLC